MMKQILTATSLLAKLKTSGLISLLFITGCTIQLPGRDTQTVQQPVVTATPIVAGADEATVADREEADGIPLVLRSSELFGYRLTVASGDNIGSVDDLIIRLGDGHIYYAVLSIGGFLGVGDDLVLAPWDLLVVDPAEHTITLNADPVALENAPVFTRDTLSGQIMNPGWDADLRTFWQDAAIETNTTVVTDTETMNDTSAITDGVTTENSAVLLPQSLLLSDLLDFAVEDPIGENLGSVEDIMIHWREGETTYLLLTVGGVLGFGDKWFAVPAGVIVIDPLAARLVLNVEPEMLEIAPGLDKDDLPSTADTNWDQEIRDFWAEWEALQNEIGS